MIRTAFIPTKPATQEAGPVVRKLIAFDDDTFDKLKQLARDRMATIQELATKRSPMCSGNTASRST